MATLKSDYKDDVFVGNRKYQLVNNGDNTVSLVDVTSYSQEGDFIDALVMNGIAVEINNKGVYQTPTAESTGTAIILLSVDFVVGKPVFFKVTTANSGAATTLNGKPFYKAGTTNPPALILGKYVAAIYSSDNGGCFFYIASAEGNAVAANVLAGKTFSNDSDTGLVGTMVDNSSFVNQTLINNGQQVNLPQGYYPSGKTVKAQITNLSAANIKAGVTVGNVSGTFTNDADAIASDILINKKAYVNGNLVTGSAPSKGATDYNPSNADQVITAGQHLTGAQTIKAITGDASPSDVLNGKTFWSAIANVLQTGNAVAGKKFQSGTVESGAIASFTYYNNSTTHPNMHTLSVSGLTFLPNLIVAICENASGWWSTFYVVLGSIGHVFCVRFGSDYTTEQAMHLSATAPVIVSSTSFYLPTLVSGDSCTWFVYGE